jgi:hypothetical protein
MESKPPKTTSGRVEFQVKGDKIWKAKESTEESLAHVTL